MVRTQLYLDDATHRRLKDLARRQGRTVSDLVREAVTRTYGRADASELERTLKGIAGLWRDRDDLGDTDAYVRRLRADSRLKRLLSRMSGSEPESSSTPT